MAREDVPPLDWQTPIVDPATGRPTPQFARFWQSLFTNEAGSSSAIEDALEGIGDKASKTRQIISGAGLTGGGDLSADRTLAVGAGTGITVNADDVAIANTAVTPSTYGSTSLIPVITIDQQGRITAATTAAASSGSSTPILTRIQLKANATKSTGAFAAHSWSATDIIQDDVTAWSSGAPTRITTPSGYTRVRITVDTWWASNSTNQRWMYVQANGGGSVLQDIRGAFVEAASCSHSGWLNVTTGDYFEINFAQNSGGNLALTGSTLALGQATRAQFEWRA